MRSFEEVWQQIQAHQGKPFVSDNGREFHFWITPEEEVHFSCWKTPASKQFVADAWDAMPCEDFRKLPPHCKPRNVLWAILHDTRISAVVPPEKPGKKRWD